MLNRIFKHAYRFSVNYFLLFKELIVCNAVCFLLKISCVVKGDVLFISSSPRAPSSLHFLSQILCSVKRDVQSFFGPSRP
ncbi:hypothetical protein SCFA_420061 [anaerobic digester metagenome]|uniref:Uncharacterized protein n=1 Tax=anaerobic digester metagenome TaxID=1263854 RepID=A0A485M7V4_9ZZZZ